MTYHCEDCRYLAMYEKIEPCTTVCEATGETVTHDVTSKTPCKDFHPDAYIRALNADSITRDT